MTNDVPTTDADFAAAADALVEARASAVVIALGAGWKPANLGDAYRLQRTVAGAIGAVRGWKVAVLTPEAQRSLGLDRPVSAPLLAPWFADSPARLSRARFIAPLLECEFAFELARDLPPRQAPYSRAEVEAAVDSMRIVIEIVDHRVPQGSGVFAELADAFNNGALIVGPKTVDWQRIDFASQGIVLRATDAGREADIALGSGHAILEGGLFEAVVMMANSQPAAHRGLCAGDIVTTGSCTGAVPASHGASYEADFGEWGRVRLTLA